YKLGLNNEVFKNAFNLLNKIKSISEDDINELEENQVGLSEFLSQFTNNQKILSLLSFINGMYFVIPPDKAAASEWIRCQREIQDFKSSGYPLGGTGVISENLCDHTQKNGGKIYTKTEVSKIIFENNRAIGIQLTNGEFIPGDIIISNAGVKNTVNLLIEKSILDDEFVNKINKYEYSLATIQVKIALDKKITDEKTIMFVGEEFNIEEAEERYQKILNLEIPDYHPILFCPIISNIDPTVAPEGKQLIYAGGGCPMPKDGFSNKKHKAGWQEACLKSMEMIFPNIRDHIL
ncbi:unnamed protein product, partial [marine sediment metagenome]